MENAADGTAQTQEAQTGEVMPDEIIKGEGEEITESQEEKALRQSYEKVKSAYPDRQFESDDDYEAALIEHLDGLETYKKQGTEANEKLVQLFESEPVVADIINDMIKGASFREALAIHIDPEELTALEGDPDYEGWEKNRKTRAEKLAEKAQKDSELAENFSFSEAQVKEFATENNLSEEEAEEYIGKLDDVLSELFNGKVSKDFLAMMFKAMNYDQSLEEARKTGEIKGRNENIIAKKEAAKSAGDNLPDVTGNLSKEKEETGKPPHKIDEIVSHTKKRNIL